MSNPSKITDRTALDRNRARAVASGNPAVFLQHEAISEVQERLSLVNRTFKSPAVITGFPEEWAAAFPEAEVVADTEVLELRQASHDLVIHGMALHWADDPVGQLVQARRALVPDGLFVAALFGGTTLAQLRAVLAEAEIAATGGLSPRILPMAEIRDLGGLLQRAGLALPVADSTKITATYASALHLMRDLRAMGEGNAMAARNRTPVRPSIFADAAARYDSAYGDGDRVPATFEFVFLTGWAPSETQPKPLRPGSAKQRLADALGAQEQGLPDKGRPAKD